MASPQSTSSPQSTPPSITLRQAYTRVWRWYRENVSRLDATNTGEEYKERSRRLIEHLPEPESATELEMRAVMAEVIAGLLEWDYRETGVYARDAVQPFGGYTLTPNDRAELRGRPLWPYLSGGEVSYLIQQAKEKAAESNFNLAEAAISQAMERVKPDYADPIDRFDVQIAASEVFERAGRWENAVMAASQALELAQQTSDVYQSHRAHMMLGHLNAEQKRLPEALQHLRAAVEIGRKGFSEQPDLFRRPLGEALSETGKVLRAQGETAEADAAEAEAKSLAPELFPTPQRSYGASPTPKAISDCWVTEDSLGYAAFARSVASLITHPETVPPLTIGIKAAWGAGKTSVMKMVQHILDGKAQVTEENRFAESTQDPQASFTFGGLLQELRQYAPRTRYVHFQKGFPWVKIGASSAPNPEPPTAPLKRSPRGEQYDLPPRATVWFNAWKYQTSEQIWAGLAHCIISQVTARMDAIQVERFWIRLHAKRIDIGKVRREVYRLVFQEFLPWALAWLLLLAISLAFLFVKTETFRVLPAVPASAAGIALLGCLMQAVKAYRGKLSEKLSGSFRNLTREPEYEGKLGFLHLVESDLRDVLDLVATKEKPLVVFVDDLDRCAPRRIAEVVEAINLFLAGDYPNTIFVIGMEPSLVAAALEVANQDLVAKLQEFEATREHTPLGWRFMEKIIQLPLMIPPPPAWGAGLFFDALVGTAARSAAAAAKVEETTVQKYVTELSGLDSVAALSAKTDDLLGKTEVLSRYAVIEASKRLYAKQFTDRDPLVKSFIESVFGLFQANPRQIKRYVNLFRFMCTLRHNLSLDADPATRPQMPTDAAVTKFVTLSLHWPHLLALLNRNLETADGDGARQQTSVLAYIESKALALASVSGSESEAAWLSCLENAGFHTGNGALSELRVFLAQSDGMGAFRGCGLW